MTTNNVLVNELGHIPRVDRINGPSFNPSTQVVPRKNDKPVATRRWRHINNIHPNFRPYHSRPSRFERFLVPVSSASLTLFACFDIFGNIIIQSLPLIAPSYLFEG